MPEPVRAARRDALLVAALTLAVFAVTLTNGWVEWDDRVNFLDNPHYRGLGWRQLVWSFTVAWNGHWTPLAWLSLGLDYVLWGLNPVGYHLTNILWHAATAALFVLVAGRLLRRVWPDVTTTTLRLGAATAALFFALHPLRVESVAWATERRDLLSGFFYLLTILAWLTMIERTDRTRARWLAVALAAYAAALLSKSIVISLPFVLLVLDIYPLRRLTAVSWRTRAGRAVLLEKVPFVLMAAAVTALTVLTFHSMLASLQDYPPLARLGIVGYSLVFYVWKTLVPADLSPIYELPWRVSLAEPAFLGSALVVAVATTVLLVVRRWWPAGLAVAVAYVLTLAPVSGVSQAGPQLVADRYSYLTMLGPALLLGGGVIAVASGAIGALRAGLVRLILGAVAVWIGVLALLTVAQVRVWHDDRTLWEHALAVNPDCAYCNAEYARYQAASGEAERRLRGLLGRDPGDVDARIRLGAVLIQSRRYGEAEIELRAALHQAPESADALIYLGLAHVESGRATDALSSFDRALSRVPTAALAHFGRGRALQALGRDAEVEPHFVALARLEPRLAERLKRRW